MDNIYSRGKIYKITSEQTDKIYIGSTIQTLNRRFSQHNFTKKKCSITSNQIVKYEDAKIELIENYPCNSKKELHARERYYIENTPNTINLLIPTRTIKEWNKANPEKVIKAKQKYRENNKEKERLYSKKYHEDNKEKEKLYRENNREKIKITQKKYDEKNKDRVRAVRLYQNTWCGTFNHNNHNNLLRIDPTLFTK